MKEYIEKYIEDLLSVACCPGHTYSCKEVYKHVKHQKKVIDRLSRKIQKLKKENNRIYKVIEYIENHIVATETEDILLKILKGSDNK